MRLAPGRMEYSLNSIAASGELIDVIKVVKEVDHAVSVVVCIGNTSREHIDEVEVIEEVDHAIRIEVGVASDTAEQNCLYIARRTSIRRLDDQGYPGH